MSAVDQSDFFDSITVTNSKTVVDEAGMNALINQCDTLLCNLATITQHLNDCEYHARNASMKQGGNLSYLDLIEQAQTQVQFTRNKIADFREKVGHVLLIFLEANHKTSEYFLLRSRLYPSLLTYADVVIEGRWFSNNFSRFLYFTGIRDTPYFSLHDVGLVPPGYGLNRLVAGVLPFVSGVGGDPVDSLTAQYYVDTYSRKLTWFVLPKEMDRYLTDGTLDKRSYRMTGGSWWSGNKPATHQAASVMASVMFIFGTAWYGQTQAVGINGPRRDSAGTYEGHSSATPSDVEATHLRFGFFFLPSWWGWNREALNNPSASDFKWKGLDESKADINESDMQRLACSSRSSSPVKTPHNASTLIGRIGTLAESADYGQFEILEHTTPTANGQIRRSWTVNIRGTQHWDGGGSNPQDMLTNFQAVAGEDSDQARAIRLAMKQIGIQAGEPVEFVGHSQGGIIAAQLAADRQIQSEYKVVSVLTAGSPTARYSPETTAGMLNLENLRDLVPATDGQANNDVQNNMTVYFDGNTLDRTDANGHNEFAHNLEVYKDALSRMENSQHSNAKDVAQWAQRRRDELGLSDATSTQRYVFNSSRLHAPSFFPRANEAQ